MRLGTALNGLLRPKGGQVMILAYDRIASSEGPIGIAMKDSGDAIDHAEFKWQMEQVDRRFAPIALSRLMGHLAGKRPLSGPQVCVSFHSDSRSSCLAVKPVLQGLKIPATWFFAFENIASSALGSSEFLEALDWKLVSELCASGDDLAHRIDDAMATFDSAKRRAHLVHLRGRGELEANVRVHSCAYAGNGSGVSHRPLLYDAALAGFNLGVSEEAGVSALRPICPMMLRRSAVSRDTTRSQFEALLNDLGPGQ